MPSDISFMRHALRLAKLGYGTTSPNPMVGAVVARGGKIIGQGWHWRAGEPHAEIEALRDAEQRGIKLTGTTLYVTLEPCSTFGRTPPCTNAIKAAGIKRVVIGAIDPNPAHGGKALKLLHRAGISAGAGVLEAEATRLNEAFNHWIVHRTPFVTVKAAMSLDGKIATKTGESKWITGKEARDFGMWLRKGADAILVGVNTVLADDPHLTWRGATQGLSSTKGRCRQRIILDALARTPLGARVVSDEWAGTTTVVLTRAAPKTRVAALARRVRVWLAPEAGRGNINLKWLLKKLGAEEVVNLLVEGGGEVNASFVSERRAHRIAFFYAPKIIGGRDAPKAVGGAGAAGLHDALRLREVEWRKLGTDLLLSARVG